MKAQEIHMRTAQTTQRPLPKLWFRLSETGGNVVQLAGLVLGAALLYLAAHLAISGHCLQHASGRGAYGVQFPAQSSRVRNE